MRLPLCLPAVASLLVFAAASAQQPASSTLPATSAMPVSPETRAVVQRIVGDTVINGQAYEYDRQLADEIGPRLTGSANYLKAVAWGVAKFRQLGLTNVHTESLHLDTWEPEPGATARILSPVEHNLHLWSWGWSPSTPKKGIEGDVVYLPKLTAEALLAAREKLHGRIILADQDAFAEPFTVTAFLATNKALETVQPAAVIVAGARDGAENMGAFTFSGTLATFPVAQAGIEDVKLLKRLVEKGTVRVEMQFTNRTRKNVEVPQVIGEIRGSEKPDEVVIVGAHLDSWNPGTGAQDNGTGAATVVDAAREISSLGHAPKRTVRFILFGGEEQGLLGSTEYVKRHRAEMDKIDAVLITDTGAEQAKGWYLMARNDEKAALAQVEPLLSGLGSDKTSEDVGFIYETDHAAFDVLGVPTLVLWTPVTEYMKLHHRASDTFDSVNKASLLQGAATVIASTYAIADSSAAFAPHYTPQQVETMLKDAKQLDDYNALKGADLLP